jgi:hypothetical protein
MVVPGEFSVQVESKVFDMIRAGKLHIVPVDSRAYSSACGERNVDRFECVGLHAPRVETGLDYVEVGLELLGSCGGVNVRGENGSVASKDCYGCCCFLCGPRIVESK